MELDAECSRCGRRKWNLVLKDYKVLDDDRKVTQKCTGILVAIKCDCCGLMVRDSSGLAEVSYE